MKSLKKEKMQGISLKKLFRLAIITTLITIGTLNNLYSNEKKYFIGGHIYNSAGTFQNNTVNFGGALAQIHLGRTIRIKQFRFDIAFQYAYIYNWRRPDKGFNELGISIFFRQYLF